MFFSAWIGLTSRQARFVEFGFRPCLSFSLKKSFRRSRSFFRPFAACSFCSSTHRLRGGLHSCTASRLCALPCGTRSLSSLLTRHFHAGLSHAPTSRLRFSP